MAAATVAAATSSALYDLAGYDVNYGQSILTSLAISVATFGVGDPNAVIDFTRISVGYISNGIAAEINGGNFSMSLLNGFSVSAAGFLGSTMARSSGAMILATKVAKFSADILGKVWASPNTAIGFALGVMGTIIGEFGHILGVNDVGPSIQFGNNGIEFLGNPFISEGEALTLGNAISYGGGEGGKPNDMGAYGDKTVQVGRHEQAHTYQYQVFGPLFAPAYFISGDAFTVHNPFEAAAQNYGRGGSKWLP